MLSALCGNETVISEETPPEYISFSIWSFGFLKCLASAWLIQWKVLECLPGDVKLIYSMSWQDCNPTDQQRRDALRAESSWPCIAQDNLHAVCFDPVFIVSNKVSNKINILQPTQFIALMRPDVQLLQLYFIGARGLRALQIAKETSDSRKPWHS